MIRCSIALATAPVRVSTSSLCVDVGEVGFHGGFADEEVLGQFLVAEPVGEQLQDFDFAGGEERDRGAGSAHEGRGDGRGEHGVTTCGVADGSEHVVGWRVLEKVAGGAGVDRCEYVGFGVVGGQDQDAWRLWQISECSGGFGSAGSGSRGSGPSRRRRVACAARLLRRCRNRLLRRRRRDPVGFR